MGKLLDWARGIGKADQSLDAQADAIRGDWDEMCSSYVSGPSPRSYVTEVYTDHVIVRSEEGDYVSVPYTLDDQGEAVFDMANATEVERTWTPIAQSGRIVAKSDDLQAVFGFANVPVRKDGRPLVDTQGDEITPEDLELAAYEFVLSSREGDLDHTEAVQSHLVESAVFTDEKIRAWAMDRESGAVDEAKYAALKSALNDVGVTEGAWWTGFFIPDREVYDKSGPGKEYDMFSIAGQAVREEVA
jgi:hypothetical protein